MLFSWKISDSCQSLSYCKIARVDRDFPSDDEHRSDDVPWTPENSKRTLLRLLLNRKMLMFEFGIF